MRNNKERYDKFLNLRKEELDQMEFDLELDKRATLIYRLNRLMYVLKEGLNTRLLSLRRFFVNSQIILKVRRLFPKKKYSPLKKIV
jgi:hypothetical protein